MMRGSKTRLIAAGAAVLLATGCGAAPAAEPAAARGSGPASTPGTTTPPPPPATTAPPQPQLPGGGTQVFPGHRLIGFAGAPSSPAFGRLTGDLAAASEQLRQQAAGYGSAPPVLPVFELIATVAQASRGPNGNYSIAADDSTVQQYLAAARAAGGILLLDIQPGSGDFLAAVQYYEKWLVQPDVGVALDPEWAVSRGQVPGDVFGHTTGAVIDSVSAYLDALVTANRLPQKVLVYHQLKVSIVDGEAAMVDRPGVAVVKTVDGIGVAADKIGTYQRVWSGTPMPSTDFTSATPGRSTIASSPLTICTFSWW